MIKEIKIQEIRQELKKALEKYNGTKKVKLNMSSTMLERLIFLTEI